MRRLWAALSRSCGLIPKSGLLSDRVTALLGGRVIALLSDRNVDTLSH